MKLPSVLVLVFEWKPGPKLVKASTLTLFNPFPVAPSLTIPDISYSATEEARERDISSVFSVTVMCFGAGDKNAGGGGGPIVNIA